MLKSKSKLIFLLAMIMFMSFACGIMSFSAQVRAQSVGTFEMENVASIRLDANGLRFKATLDDDALNTIDDIDSKLYFIVMPAEYLDVCDGDYSKAVKADKCLYINVPKANIGKVNPDDNFYYAYAGISPVNPNNYNLNFVAIACIETAGEETTYRYASIKQGVESYPITSQYKILVAAALEVSTDYTSIIATHYDWFGNENYPILIDDDTDYSKLLTKKDNAFFAGKKINIANTVTTYNPSDFEGSQINESDITYELSTNVKYTVKHFQQNLNDDGYTFIESDDTLTGTEGEYTNAQANSYEGFEVQEISQEVINRNGETVVNVYYNRRVLNLTFNLNNGTDDVDKSVKYGTLAKDISISNPTLADATFVGWYYNGSAISGEEVVTDDITIDACYSKVVALNDVQYIEMVSSTAMANGSSEYVRICKRTSLVHPISSSQVVELSGVLGNLISLKMGETEITGATFENNSLSFPKTIFGQTNAEGAIRGDKNIVATIIKEENSNPIITTTATIKVCVCDYAIFNADDFEAMQYVAQAMAGQGAGSAIQKMTGYIVLAKDIIYNETLDSSNGYDNTNNRTYWSYMNQAGQTYTGGFNGTLDGRGHNVQGLVMTPHNDQRTGSGIFSIVSGVGSIRNISFTHGVALGDGFLVGGVISNDGAAIYNIAIQLDYMEGSKGQGSGWLNTNGAVRCYECYGSNYYFADIFVKIDSYSGTVYAWGRGSRASNFHCVVSDPSGIYCNKPSDDAAAILCKDYSANHATYAAFKQNSTGSNHGGAHNFVDDGNGNLVSKNLAPTCTTFWEYMDKTYLN